MRHSGENFTKLARVSEIEIGKAGVRIGGAQAFGARRQSFCPRQRTTVATGTGHLNVIRHCPLTMGLGSNTC
jgi:hypothetical protein